MTTTISTTTLRRLARRALPLAVLAVLSALALSACGGGSTVTRARLERNLPVVFSNLYVQQAAILGHKGITTHSLHAKAQCDKGGPKAPDTGPGSDWICLMTWHDPNVSMADGPGKFELNVHSNDCYTAGGPSKLVGLITITDTHGNDVDNPVFEFDSCFDPNSNNTPTGVIVPPAPASATATPATTTTAKP
jgi:hypothetical protein